jgi:lambda family phage portal protein
MFDRLRGALTGFGAGARALSDGIEAGRMSRRLAGWVPSRAHVNTLIQSAGATTQSRARFLARNNGYAQNAVECFAANVVGAGIVPRWLPLDDAEQEYPSGVVQSFPAAAKALWTDWTDDADSEGLTDLYGIQRRIARELFIAGECFIRRRPRRLEDGLTVPLQLQMLPSEMLDLAYNDTLANGFTIRQGIEFDPIGRRIAYHFWRVHPGDTTDMSLQAGQRTRVPAADVLHIFDPVEGGQIRGLSRLTAAIVTLFMLDAYDDAELDRKKTAALFALFIKRTDPDGELFDAAVEKAAKASGEGTADVRLQPGLAQVLFPGEDISVAAPADVGPSFEAFQYRALARICAGLGLPYAGVTGDLVRANYANQRAALIEARRRLEAIQHSVLVFQFCRPVIRWFADAAALAGALDMPGYADDPAPYLRVRHIPPRWEWVDPLKDRQAEALAVDNGFKARSDVIEAEGADPEEVDARIAEDQAREKRLGIAFRGSAPPDPVADTPADASNPPAPLEGSS